MSEGFATYIQSERDRLNTLRATALEARAEIDDSLAAIDREFAAIDAYEAAKTGKTQAPAKKGSVPRARRGSRREGIVNALRAAPLGLMRSEITTALGVKGDKAGEMSVSNALTALKKAGAVQRQENGRWTTVAGAMMDEAAE